MNYFSESFRFKIINALFKFMFPHYRLFFFVLFFIFQSCSQIYDPALDRSNNIFVIEGLVSDFPGESYVKIFKTVPFDSIDSKIPITNARVEIIEDSDKVFFLTPFEDGVYKNEQLIGRINSSYTLTVITSDNEIYRSSPERMSETNKQDTIYAYNQQNVTYHVESSGKLIENKETGVMTFVNLRNHEGKAPMCRYKIIVTGLYSYLEEGLLPNRIYGWKTFDMTNSSLNITYEVKGAKPGECKNHEVGFFSTNLKIYLPIDKRAEVLMGFLVKLNKYTLTKNAYNYYINLQEQLKASQKLFDPLPSQLVGNIKCITNSNKPVFGIFDVSSREDLYYDYYIGNQIRVVEVDSFPNFTNEGEFLNPPPFWPPPR